MSAIAVVFDPSGQYREGAVHEALDCMPLRGSDFRDVAGGPGIELGVSRFEWERTPAFSDRAGVVESDGLAVVADATIYYRDDLCRGLERASVRPRGKSPSDLILAAYRAWGPDCVDRLEGDYAFVVWDAVRRHLFCARDFGASRPLYWSRSGQQVIVASSADAMVRAGLVVDEFNLAVIADRARGGFLFAAESPYLAISELPPAHAVTFDVGREQVRRFWTPPRLDPVRVDPRRDADEELVHVLRAAVRERIDPSSTTSVWLSGGRDSTAVYGMGRSLMADRSVPHGVEGVSISYPPGDPGREDGRIQALVDHWGATTHWIDVRDLPFLAHLVGGVHEREDLVLHVYEDLLRALCQGTIGVGARVALTGRSAEALFACSRVHLADLLASGQWAAFRQEYRALGFRGARQIYRWGIRPRIPHSALHSAAMALRRRPPEIPLRQPMIPSWIREDAVTRYKLRERAWADWTGLPQSSAVGREAHSMLMSPQMTRGVAQVAALGFSLGVEVRTPFRDRRMIDFSAGLSWKSRRRGREMKVLLRRAMAPFLPDTFDEIEGQGSGYCNAPFVEPRRRILPPLVESAFGDAELVRYDIVDRDELMRAGSACAEGGRLPPLQQSALMITLHAELWLQARTARNRAERPRSPTSRVRRALATPAT